MSYASELEAIANAIVAPGKGILAADESSPTIKKRFDSIGVESTAENRRSYRELLFTTPGAEKFISGVILFDETLRQSAADGTPFAKVLDKVGIIPGIKVDKGAKALPGAEGEKVTEGLDGLRERLDAYYDAGARFAKWRAVIAISDALPTRYAIHANAHAMAVACEPIDAALACNQAAASIEACAAGLGFGRFLSYQVESLVAQGGCGGS